MMKLTISNTSMAIRVLVLAAAVALVPTAALAQETYVYPGTNATTEFTLGNINSEAVGVDLLFYDATTGESVPHALVIDPGAQVRLTPESIGLDAFDGSTVITADVPIATTASLFESPAVFDHLSPVESSVEVVIPLAPLGGTATEVVIFNPGDEAARARVILVSEDGQALSFNDRTVEPKRTAAITLISNPDARYVVIRTSNFFLGGRAVSAAAIVRNFDPPNAAAVTRLDLAYSPGRPLLAEPSTTRIPLFLQGGGFMSVAQIINNANTAQSVTLTALGEDGSPVTGGSNPVTLDLGPRAAHTETVEDLFDISDVTLQAGSILVEGDIRLTASVAIGAVSDPGIAIVPADPATVQDFAYQTRQVGREFEWLVSLLNPSSSQANLEMTFVRDDGSVVSTVPLTIPANSQIASTLAELYPEAQGGGFVLFHSDTPLFATGLESRSDRDATSLRRALPASPDFMSPDPVELFAVGTVRSAGIGLPGVTVRLTGTESAITLTDSAGTFLFGDLSPGAYSISAEAIGYTLAPAARDFALVDESSRNNDFDASLVVPAITRLTPGAAPVGSGAVEVTVEGGPFIAGSVARLGSAQLATTVVNSMLLQATVPTTLLQSPQQLNFIVRNVGVAGNSVDSAPVVFTVGNPPPTLLSLSGQPNPLIAGSAGFTLGISGSGFLPGATVLVDGVPRSAVFISDTQLEANVTTAELETGGFLPVTALNPGPAVPSNALNLVVLNPPPDITAISPDTAEIRLSPTAPPMPLTVTGAGFQEDATVLIDSTAVPTVFMSDTMLTASVPASLLAVSGVHNVQVSNPEPSAGPSFAAPLTLTNPVPILTSVTGSVAFDPGQAGSDQPAPVLLVGANFAPNSTAWVSLPCDALGFRALPNITVPAGETLPEEYQTRRLGPGTITATVNLQCAGDYLFQVRSPQPGGGVSATATLTVP